MIKKEMSLSLLVLFLVLALLAGCGGGTNPNPTLQTSIIDISHDSPTGYGFGDVAMEIKEIKRWQTFIATSYPVVTAVEVKIKKMNVSTNSVVLVDLYATNTGGEPIGSSLAHGSIPPDWIDTNFTVVKTGLSYNGLTAGKQYAVVLTQATLSNDHYEWCASGSYKVNPQLHFGKNTTSGWVDESVNGDGWLKVYVASAKSTPTKIYLYTAGMHNGNLKGSYPDARTGADVIAANRPLNLAGKTVHAFISISATDSIANMPASFGFPSNIPIVSPSDDTKIIADSWSDLLDGTIKIPLNDVFGLSGPWIWWSGSNSDGTYYSNVIIGRTDSVTASWINQGFANGSNEYYVLGIAY